MKAWKTITITSGEKVKIDAEDVVRVAKHSWRATTGTTGRQRIVTSIRTDEGARSVTLGKFLMKPKKGLQVYPRRFNEGFDYRKDNLVVCTLQERQRLLPKKKTDSTSEFRGVSFVKSTKKWRAGIEVDGVSMNLGTFESETEAALAYNEASREHFGKLGYQNSVKRLKKANRS